VIIHQFYLQKGHKRDYLFFFDPKNDPTNALYGIWNAATYALFIVEQFIKDGVRLVDSQNVFALKISMKLEIIAIRPFLKC